MPGRHDDAAQPGVGVSEIAMPDDPEMPLAEPGID
jgi:hypothetical protein